jgi:tetratricopeptide (TPR) repeat protein
MKSRSHSARVRPNQNENGEVGWGKLSGSFGRSPSLIPRRLSFRGVRSSLTHATSSAEEEEESEVQLVNPEGSVEVCMGGGRSAECLFVLGQHEYSMERFDEALDCWTQALQSDPKPHMREILLQKLIIAHLEANERLLSAEQEEIHETLADRYYDLLRPRLSNRNIHLVSSPLWLDYLVQKEEWSAAARLDLEGLHKDLKARILYQAGIQSTAPVKDRMDHMTQCLACCPESRLKLAAHAELVQLHTASGNYLEAIQHHEERLALLKDSNDIVKAFYEEGDLYLALGVPKKALQSLEKGLALDPKSVSLLEAKANVLHLLGRTDEAISILQDLTQRTEEDFATHGKLLYTLGRMCSKSHRRALAKQYFLQELDCTQKNLGTNHLECSRIYHELAKVEDDDLDFRKALDYYRKALQIEVSQPNQSRELAQLIQETKKRMGKLYYKLGDFDQALHASFGN